MNRNIAKQFTATLSLLDVASDKTHKYKCFHGEDIQLTVNVVGENNRLIDLSNTSVKIYFTLDKNVNEPVYRQDTGIVVDNLGIITVMLEKSYIRIGNNTLKIVLYDEDQTVFLQPLIISCIDPLIGEVADLEIPDDIDVRDELYDIRRTIGDLQDFDDDLGREIIEARNEYGTVGRRLDNFDSQLDKKVSKEDLILEARSKRVQGENTKDDTKGTFDSANFAGQDLGKNAPIGNVMHHYTDGICFQIDNVGEDNNILILKNAYNPSRRPDKSEDFVGTGLFLQCLKAVIGSTSLSMFKIDKDGNLIWTDKSDKVEFISNKDDDGKAVFSFKNYKEHQNLFEIINAGMWELTVKHENNQCVLQSGNKATDGLKLESVLGKVEISSSNTVEIKAKNKGNVDVYGVLRVQEGASNYNRVVTVRSGATDGRPTDGLYTGMMYLDTALGVNGKVIWWNGINWIDAMGSIV